MHRMQPGRAEEEKISSTWKIFLFARCMDSLLHHVHFGVFSEHGYLFEKIASFWNIAWFHRFWWFGLIFEVENRGSALF